MLAPISAITSSTVFRLSPGAFDIKFNHILIRGKDNLNAGCQVSDDSFRRLKTLPDGLQQWYSTVL